MVKITVFTGFVGAGKTTIILDLAKALGCRIALLKNEYGDNKVDSQLAAEANLSVTEIANGCICCVKVGQLDNAIRDLIALAPDRVFVECSGTAFPAAIVWQLKDFDLDAVITVVDCENFVGYADVSYTARIQAAYTDLIVLNKWRDVTEHQLDSVLDKVLELNLDTPRIRYTPKALLAILEGCKGTNVQFGESAEHKEFDTMCLEASPCSLGGLKSFLATLPRDTVYRVKGTVLADGRPVIVNHAFGRFKLHEITAADKFGITIMGRDLSNVKSAFIRFFESQP